MYLAISLESVFKTAVAAIALKPEFDNWLYQKKTQLQLENQASLFKLTQADLSSSINPAIDQISNTVKEVQLMVKSVVDLSKESIPSQRKMKYKQMTSEGEEEKP